MTEMHPIVKLIEDTYTKAEQKAMPPFLFDVKEGFIIGGPETAENCAEVIEIQLSTLVQIITLIFPDRPEKTLGLASRISEQIMQGVKMMAYEGRPNNEFIADIEMLNAANKVRAEGGES